MSTPLCHYKEGAERDAAIARRLSGPDRGLGYKSAVEASQQLNLPRPQKKNHRPPRKRS